MNLGDCRDWLEIRHGHIDQQAVRAQGGKHGELFTPVAHFALRLVRAYPNEKGGLLYVFSPHYEAETDADGRFRFEGVKSGERYALVDMSSGRPSPLKRADGSTVLLELIKDPKSIALGDIRVE